MGGNYLVLEKEIFPNFKNLTKLKLSLFGNKTIIPFDAFIYF